MIARILFWITRNRPTRLIKLDGKPYLERHFVAEFMGICFYLHRFVRDDNERHLHDHPWLHAFSIVLHGHYKEQRGIAKQYAGNDYHIDWGFRNVRWFNYIPRRHHEAAVHRIVNIKPETWTLFFHSTWEFEWGFYKKQFNKWVYEKYAGTGTDKRWWLDPKTPPAHKAGREPFGG